MGVKLIISDVDGCLTTEASEPWDQEHLLELGRLQRAAVAGQGTMAPITLCTGRPQPYVEALMKLLCIQEPCICENGVVLYTLHDNYARYAPGVTDEKVQGIRRVRTFIEKEILTGREDAFLQFGKESQISVFSQTPEIFPAMQAKIESFVGGYGGPELLINQSHYYLNISLKGVDKGSALSALLDMLGLTRGDVAGIGDTEGDLPLREVVGFFACPANATEPIKAIADYVSPYPLLEGVLDILRLPQFQKG
jgi:HAD superfamily hydrolase (TIGR01484 family)